MVLLVPGEGAKPLSERLGKLIGADLADVEFKTFPDGEEYARILTPLKGQDVVVVQTGYPTARLWKLLLLLNAAGENGAKTVRAVVPYMPYARQDRIFLEGEALSAKVVGDAIRTHASACVTVELHKEEVRNFFGGTCQNLSAVEPFAADFKARGVQLVLAPDAGARPRAEAVARLMGAAVDHLEKKRISSEIVEMKPKSLDVRGKKVAILDDIISTGGTMAKAVEQLVRQGASNVVCAGVHGLFIAEAANKLKTAGASEILSSDSIPSPYSKVGMAGEIAKALMVRAFH